MPKVNDWLVQRIDRGPGSAVRAAAVNGAIPTQPLPLIVETVTDEQVPDAVAQIIERLPGTQRTITRGVFNFFRVTTPLATLDQLLGIPEIRTISYDAPVFIRQTPFLRDPLLGDVQLSRVTIPLGPAEALALAPVRLALAPLAGLAILRSFGLPVPFVGSGPQASNVIIIPSGQTREWMGVPAGTQISTKVAVLDTGAFVPHPLLQNQPKMLSTTGEAPWDLLGHGQWCITMAFGGAFNTRFGECRGVVEALDALSVKCLSNIGFGTSFGVLQAMEIAWREGAKVVNMSLGGTLQGSVTEDPQCVLVERLSEDMIFCVAAGNSGPDPWTIGSPGAAPSALTVGAWSSFYDGLAIFSSRGPSGEYYRDNPAVWDQDLATFGDRLVKPDCVAPGGGPVSDGQPQDQIYSGVTGWMDGIQDLTPGDLHDSMRGTSMACPHVAGLVAYGVERGLISTAADVKREMAATAAKNPESGYGVISLDRLRGLPAPPPPTPEPPPAAGPTAAFSVTTDGLTATFTNNSLNAFSFEWDFGDGSAISTERSPSHTYAADGSYSVALKALGGPFEDLFTRDISVSAPALPPPPPLPGPSPEPPPEPPPPALFSIGSFVYISGSTVVTYQVLDLEFGRVDPDTWYYHVAQAGTLLGALWVPEETLSLAPTPGP